MTPQAGRDLAFIVDVFRYYRVPLIVTSRDRTVAHNREVGGVEGSLHTVGRAADVVPDASWNRPGVLPLVAQICEVLGAAKAIPEPDHVHLEFFS